MNWKPSGTGFEPKRIAALAVLVLVLGYFLWPSSPDHGAATPAPRPSHAVAPPPIESMPAASSSSSSAGPSTVRRGRGRDSGMDEFRPSLRKVRQANTDPSRIDPTLRLDLLARLQNVKLEGGMRSLFEALAAPPPPKVKEPNAIRPTRPVKPMPAIATNQPPPGPPPPPPPPPIPLKFYGFVNPNNASDRRAFFLEGDDIFVAREGEVVQKRYKIIRIGVSAAVVEDTQFSNQQSLPIIAEGEGATG